MLSTVLSLLILATLVLLTGAWFLWRRGERKRPALMLLLAVVAAINVGIWTLPGPRGEAPVDAELR